MYPLLLTTTNEKQPDAVVAWDPLAGNPIATLPGEPALHSSVATFNGGVVCAANKKPFIQLWNFQNAASNHKRVLTKSLVSALTFTPDGVYLFLAFDRDVYVYQTSSGCLIGIIEGGHSARIGEMKLATRWPSNPPMLVTADSSGFVACWSLGSLVDELGLLSSDRRSNNQPIEGTEDGAQSANKQTPIWYTLQASRSLPRLDFVQSAVLIAGSDGLKVVNLLDGTVIGTTLTGIPGGLHSLCCVPTIGKVFSGADDGVLHTTYVSMKQQIVVTRKEVRRCFTNSQLPTAMKAITELILAPVDYSLLVVGARGGLIEVLRPDAFLTRLQQFSVLNPINPTDATVTYQLTGLCFVPRPDWLCTMSERTTSVNSAATHESDDGKIMDTSGEASSASRNFFGIEPLKRRFGWHLDDIVRVRLPARSEWTDISSEMSSVYMDEFYMAPEEVQTAPDKSEVSQLRQEIEKLTSANRELLRRLVDDVLRS
ncbi:unnamed protein product [Calicophoron daubneyi]|uniref:Pre-rRNA-processing protein IPI3 n=1 Tax=Calicophoron daubneyi TaxID=300641 RepID=A0AAV2TU88_CALDB